MNFIPNAEQTKSALRSLIIMFGAGLAGWVAHSGYVTQQQVMDILNNTAFQAFVATTLVPAIWGLFVHKQSNAIAVADAVPDVAGVVMKDTAAGAAIAEANPSPTVAVAGTQAAANVATT